MITIGFKGEIGSGKDTAGDYLVEKYNYEKRAMAENLKKAAQVIFSFEDHQLYGTQEQKETPDPRWENVTPRKIMQYFGTECMRDQMYKIMPEMGKAIWVKSLEISLHGKTDNICICDIRYKEEADLVKRLGGIIINLKRDRVRTESHNHTSELEMQNIPHDYEIDNNGTLEALYQQLDIIIK